MDKEVFFECLVILHHILSSILIIYPIGKEYLTFNSSICLEIVVASINFGVKKIGFAFTPKVKAAGGL